MTAILTVSWLRRQADDVCTKLLTKSQKLLGWKKNESLRCNYYSELFEQIGRFNPVACFVARAQHTKGELPSVGAVFINSRHVLGCLYL